MWLIFFVFLSASFGATLSFCKTPLVMGGWVLFLAFSVSVVFGSFISSWFAFLFFLIYVGGMLVMFAYFSAISPNQEYGGFGLGFLAVVAPSVIFVGWGGVYSLKVSSLSKILWFFYPSNIPVFIFLSLILFFTMVCVVKVVNSSKGAFRPWHVYV